VARLRAIEELTRPFLDFAQAAFLHLAAVLPLSSTYSQPILDPLSSRQFQGRIEATTYE
jgi:hypothetical protein